MSAVGRQRALELRRTLRLVWVDKSVWPRAQGWGDRAVSGCGVAFMAVYLWVAVSYIRGQMVDWQGEVDWVKAAAWLLWGLGGGWVALVTLMSASAWPERAVRKIGLSTKPLVELLPLTRRELWWAKVQGRTLGWLAHVALAWGVMMAARGLMVRHELVVTAPGVLDPWLMGGALLFAAGMILSNRTAWVDRDLST